MNNKLTVLFLSSWYPNRVQPTLGNFVQRHAEAVSKYANVIVLHVCSDINNKKQYEILESKINDVFTINIYYKKVEHNLPVFSQFQKAVRYIRAYNKGLKILSRKIEKIDIVHLNVLFPVGIIALYLKKIKSISYVATEHWTGYLPSDGAYKGFFRKWITKWIAGNASCVMPVSYDLKNAMESHGLETAYAVIPNVVDTNLFYPQQNKIINSKIRIIHISMLDDQQKNISGLLRVMHNLAKKRQDFELSIIGDSTCKADLEELATKLGLLNKKVFFLGLKNKEDLAVLLRKSDFFVLFSNYENQPCVLIESIASGIPVVATNVGGVTEFVSEKQGLILEPKDELALEKAMEWMFSNYSTFNVNDMHKHAEKYFSLASVGQQFYQLYLKKLTDKLPD